MACRDCLLIRDFFAVELRDLHHVNWCLRVPVTNDFCEYVMGMVEYELIFPVLKAVLWLQCDVDSSTK
jgi:hypothetical protein